MSINPSDLAALTSMYENAGALQLKELEQKYNLGKSQIANAMKIAQMESKDKRYGIEAVREVGLANIAQMKLEMEKIGIPRVEIEKYVAEKNYEIAAAELALKREVDIAGLTGEYEGKQTLDAQEQHFRQQLDAAKFGAELASTPDTYYQARRYAANDLPRLMGMGTQYGAAMEGSPTPGVARMGEFLGQSAYAANPDPNGQRVGITDPGFDPNAAARRGTPPPTPYGGQAPSGYTADQAPQAGAAVSAQEGERINYIGGGGPVESVATQQQQDARAKQIAQIAKAVPPSPYDGLNDQDASTLKLMESIYKRGGAGVAGGELERLNASGRIGFLRSAGNLLGYSPKEFESEYQMYRPSQGASNLAG